MPEISDDKIVRIAARVIRLLDKNLSVDEMGTVLVSLVCGFILAHSPDDHEFEVSLAALVDAVRQMWREGRGEWTTLQ
jgi:hypothetical protein